MKNILLKLMATLCFLSCGFTFMLACDTNRFGNLSPPRLLLWFAVILAVFGLGCLVTALARRLMSGIKGRRLKKTILILSRISGVLTFFAGLVSLIAGGDAATVLALGVWCAISFFIGERFIYKSFTDMFPLSALGFYIVFSLAGYIMIRVAVPEEIRETVSDTAIAAFVLEFIMSALLINQSGIYFRANMRKETKASLPKGLSAYNAALILGVSMTALGLTVFRKQIAWLLEQAAYYVIRGIVALFSLFQAEQWTIETGTAEGISEGWTEQRSGNYILQALGIIAAAVLIIVFRRQIWRAVKGFFGRLGQLFGSKPEESDLPEFTDVFEDFSRAGSKRVREVSQYQVAAKYKAEKDPVKKFRLGYLLLLLKIRSFNHTLSEADTTYEQAEKGARYYPSDTLHSIASSYDGVRYGGKTATQSQLDELDEILKQRT